MPAIIWTQYHSLWNVLLTVSQITLIPNQVEDDSNDFTIFFILIGAIIIISVAALLLILTKKKKQSENQRSGKDVKSSNDSVIWGQGNDVQSQTKAIGQSDDDDEWLNN